jgi:hypothetical protein
MGKVKDAVTPLETGDCGYVSLHGEDFFFTCTSNGWGETVKVTHEGINMARNYPFTAPVMLDDVKRAIENDWTFWFGGKLNVHSVKNLQCPVTVAGVNLLDKPHSTVDPNYNEQSKEGETWLDENGWLKPKYERLLQKQEPWKR